MKPLSSELAREYGRRGAAARWAKPRPGEPFRGSFLAFLDAIGRSGPSRATWRVFWKAADGLPLDEIELTTFRQHTARDSAPTTPARECWLPAGRRAGKSENMAARATWRAISRNWKAQLQAGEIGIIPLIAADRAQARNSLSYLKGLTRHSLVAPYVARVLRDSVEFSSGATVLVATASFKSTRGYTMLDVILEECAFYASEDSANPDEEILAAIRPALLTVPDARVYGVSSPYARRGILHAAYQEHWGKDGDDVLVFSGDTLSLNPTVSAQVIARAFEEDPARAASEYGRDGRVAFRTDVERFLSVDAIDGVVNRSRPLELAPRSDVAYVGWADPSGGSQDSFVLAIGHREGERAVLDLVRERKPPFSPDEVCREFAGVARAYRVTELSGDHYAGAWVVERFAQHGVTYRPSVQTKTEVYREVLAIINARRAELPDHAPLRTQLANLERRVGRSGADTIGAVVGAHDDLSDASCGALLLAVGGAGTDWELLMGHFDRSMAPRHGAGCAVCHPVSGGVVAARVVRLPGALSATSQRCGCGATFNADDRIERCPHCGRQLEGTLEGVARLPPLFAPLPEQPAENLGAARNCPRCGAPGGAVGTCAACGHVN